MYIPYNYLPGYIAEPLSISDEVNALFAIPKHLLLKSFSFNANSILQKMHRFKNLETKLLYLIAPVGMIFAIIFLLFSFLFCVPGLLNDDFNLFEGKWTSANPFQILSQEMMLLGVLLTVALIWTSTWFISKFCSSILYPQITQLVEVLLNTTLPEYSRWSDANIRSGIEYTIEKATKYTSLNISYDELQCNRSMEMVEKYLSEVESFCQRTNANSCERSLWYTFGKRSFITSILEDGVGTILLYFSNLLERQLYIMGIIIIVISLILILIQNYVYKMSFVWYIFFFLCITQLLIYVSGWLRTIDRLLLFRQFALVPLVNNILFCCLEEFAAVSHWAWTIAVKKQLEGCIVDINPIGKGIIDKVRAYQETMNVEDISITMPGDNKVEITTYQADSVSTVEQPLLIKD